MKLKDIAVFKHFIAGKNLHKPFINAYNGCKEWAKLPNNIEDYLSNAEHEDVIIKATRICKPNGAFDYTFWFELNADWLEYYNKMRSSGFFQKLEGLESLSGYFNILRENWNDAQKPWRFEDINIARIRLGLVPVDEKDSNETVESKEETDGSEINFVDFVTYRRTANVLQQGILSLNLRGHSWRLTINRKDAKEIKEKGVNFAMVGSTRSGDIMLMFCNNPKGIPVICSKDKYYNINNRQLCEYLSKSLSLSDDLVYLRMDKVSEKDNSITYKISLQ